MADQSKSEDWATERPSHVPWPLWKAVHDSFEYRMRLRTGEVLDFMSAEIDGEWVTLLGLKVEAQLGCVDAERGVVVRISEIAWCVDAPNGT